MQGTRSVEQMEIGEVRKVICALAGALAEQACERFGDNLIDPDFISREAGKVWDELLKQQGGEL